MTDLAASVMTDRPDDTPSDVASADSAENMVPAIHLPERADSPVSEITERFLRAVIAKVPLDRIEELHLFSPLRQGGVETGIAVIAARVPVPMAAIETDERGYRRHSQCSATNFHGHGILLSG